MSEPLIIAFDAGGTAVKAALYDGRGRECAVAVARVEPNPELAAILDRRRAVFKALRDASGPMWRAL